MNEVSKIEIPVEPAFAAQVLLSLAGIAIDTGPCAFGRLVLRRRRGAIRTRIG